MKDIELEKLFEANNFKVRFVSKGRWVHNFHEDYKLNLIHDEEKEDLFFKIVLKEFPPKDSISFLNYLLKFNIKLPNGSFGLDQDDRLVFTDRIPTFHLHWGEVDRTVLTAEKVCENVEIFLNKALINE